jgi:hypothetical protein
MWVYGKHSFKEWVVVTIAVCFKCGNFKKGAFNPCGKCNALPKCERELALSIVMTDHYFSQLKLEHLSECVRHGGKPELSADVLRDWSERIRDSGMLNHPNKLHNH